MVNFIAIIQEFRKWIILFIFIIVILGVILSIRSCKVNNLIKENDSLKKDKKVLLDKIKDLEDELNHKPEVVIKTVEKKVLIKKCFENGKEIKCDSSHEPIEVSITKEDCCKLGISVEIKNRYFICKDNDICKEGDESIELTEEGKKKFTEIKEGIIELGKKSVWDFSFIGGWDFIQPGFPIGMNILNYNGIISGIDIDLDIKKLSESNLGLYLGYRPQFFKKWKLNFAFIGGVGTPLNNIAKEWTGQAGIVFYFVERK